MTIITSTWQWSPSSSSPSSLPSWSSPRNPGRPTAGMRTPSSQNFHCITRSCSSILARLWIMMMVVIMVMRIMLEMRVRMMASPSTCIFLGCLMIWYDPEIRFDLEILQITNRLVQNYINSQLILISTNNVLCIFASCLTPKQTLHLSIFYTRNTLIFCNPEKQKIERAECFTLICWTKCLFCNTLLNSKLSHYFTKAAAQSACLLVSIFVFVSFFITNQK